jgi:transcriptional regulator with XRE-family HTH domain
MPIDLPAFTTVGPLVAELRRRAGLQGKELAQLAGMSRFNLSKLENDRLDQLPSAETFQRIGEATKASAAEITAMLRLAKKAPAEVQQWVREEPAVTELYRSTQALPPAERAAFLQRLVADARERLGLPVEDAHTADGSRQGIPTHGEDA